MKTCAEPLTAKGSTEGNEVNEGGSRPTGRARAGGPAPFWNPLRSLRLLLLISVRPAVLFAAVALFPASSNAQAIQAWVQLSDIPNHFSASGSAGLALDASGNVVVSGPSYGGDTSSDDWLTIKYSSAGTPLWTNRYHGPGSGRSWPGGVAVDASGNVYVTGSADFGPSWNVNSTTIKYSSSGVPLWTNWYDGPAHGLDGTGPITVDVSENVIVTGNSWNGTDYDCLTIKYSSDGVPLWTRRYNGPDDGQDYGSRVKVDASGNVSVFGSTAWPGYDVFVLEYSSAGALLRARTYADVDYGGHHTAQLLAEDHSGNVIRTGCLQRPTTGLDLATVKYSSAGVPLWTNYYNGPIADGSDEGNAVVVDANDDVYVTGVSEGITTFYDYVTIKYSSAGMPLWTNRYGGLGMMNYFNIPRALALDASGNVIVTGQSTGTGGIDLDFATIAYSRSGVPLWTNRYNGPGNKSDNVSNLAVDASNNVYVVGYSETSDSSINTQRAVFATIKYVVPPIIARQPLSRTNAVGTTASFTVEAAGGLPLSYQWRRQGTNLVNGGNVSGVTTTNLQIANVQAADTAGYTVVVTNAYGSTTSSVAQLTVYVPPNPGRFTNFSYSPATGFSFIFRDGTLGRPYRIQVSPSLAEGGWVDWQNFNYLGPVGFSDLGALETTNRFYRAVSP
jgi:hypothetical protein